MSESCLRIHDECFDRADSSQTSPDGAAVERGSRENPTTRGSARLASRVEREKSRSGQACFRVLLWGPGQCDTTCVVITRVNYVWLKPGLTLK